MEGKSGEHGEFNTIDYLYKNEYRRLEKRLT